MRRCYLLVHSPKVASHEQMKVALNQIAEVKTWRTDIPHCFYVISQEDAKTLSSLIRNATSKTGRFIVSEIPDNRYGWLTEESWFFIKNLKVKPAE
jgi:hypothetical protein